MPTVAPATTDRLLDRLLARLAGRLLRRPGVAGLVNRAAGTPLFAQRHAEQDPFAALPGGFPGLMEGFASGAGPSAQADVNRIYGLAQAAQAIERDGVAGAVAEFGVYKGKTAALLRRLLPRRDLYLFDTFDGFDPRDIDGEGERVDEAGRRMLGAAFKDSGLDAVRRLVGDAANTHYVIGRFPDSAAALEAGQRFALVHVDCDLYEPARAACDWFYPRLAPGGFMLFHDYNSPHWPGIARAVNEYFAGTPVAPVPLPDHSGTVCVRRGWTG